MREFWSSRKRIYFCSELYESEIIKNYIHFRCPYCRDKPSIKNKLLRSFDKIREEIKEEIKEEIIRNVSKVGEEIPEEYVNSISEITIDCVNNIFTLEREGLKQKIWN